MGAISVGRRKTAPIPDRQVAVLGTFSDESVSAIESAHLLRDLQSRNHELTDPLEQRMGTSGILRIFLRSRKLGLQSEVLAATGRRGAAGASDRVVVAGAGPPAGRLEVRSPFDVHGIGAPGLMSWHRNAARDSVRRSNEGGLGVPMKTHCAWRTRPERAAGN
jgi:hypothetical protein